MIFTKPTVSISALFYISYGCDMRHEHIETIAVKINRRITVVISG